MHRGQCIGKGGGRCNTPIVKPWTYDPSCDLCSFVLWTYDILYNCGIFLLFMINLIKEFVLMFNNMNLYFDAIINVNVLLESLLSLNVVND